MQCPLTYSQEIGFVRFALMGIIGNLVLFGSGVIATTAPISNGLILQVRGNAQLERQELYMNPLPGLPIYPGDRLLASEGGELTVLCSDLTIEVVSNDRLNPCTTPTTPSLQICNPDTYECPHRGDEGGANANNEIPYPISPRRTYLLDDRPPLSWNPVAGASQYTISLIEDGTPLWQVTTSQTQLDYPSDRSLRSGVTYLLTIETDTGRFSLEEPQISGGVSFGLLPDESRRELQETQAQIEAQGLDESAQNLALSFLYVQQGLISEGIDILEKLIESGMNNTLNCARLRELYFDYLKLPEHAIEPEIQSYCQPEG